MCISSEILLAESAKQRRSEVHSFCIMAYCLRNDIRWQTLLTHAHLIYRLGAVEKQAMSAADEKAFLAAQLKSKEDALKTAMNKRSADYDPAEVQELEEQVQCEQYSVLSTWCKCLPGLRYQYSRV